MFSLLAQSILFNPTRPLASTGPSAARLAQDLLHQADACAERDPHRCDELRHAAKMYLALAR
ncbi:MAG: hypothetical protein ABIP34_13010 [Rhodoferax sp.]|uniref:hypothetical protein n=1 Tax=Rhodoferax sp. TaxID=50421 RepID=UPI0032643A2E